MFYVYFHYYCHLLSSQKYIITLLIKTAFHHYFCCKVGDQDKSLEPYICCNSCTQNLHGWMSNKVQSVPFTILMVWWLLYLLGASWMLKIKKALNYPNISSATSVQHGDDLTVPVLPSQYSLEPNEDMESGWETLPKPSPQDPNFVSESDSFL